MSLIANYPSLLSHKGTLIRLRITFANDERISIEPLRYAAGGLILKSTAAKALIDIPDEYGATQLALLGHDGRCVRTFSVPSNPEPKAFESFVVYPNGSTFQGAILENQAATPALLIWSTELVRRMKVENDRKVFTASHWSEVPTIVSFIDATQHILCMWKEHSCPDCSFMTKSFEELPN